MKVVVTGGAGFIGSHLVDRLVGEHEVTVIDDLSTGRRKFLNPKAEFVEGSLLDLELGEVVEGADIVFHLAANPEVRDRDPGNHLEQNFLAAHKLLEAMRSVNVDNIVYTSSSTVYGEAETPTGENHPIRPISLYGAANTAAEAWIYSYTHTFDFKATIYRFANVVGSRLRHGVIYDFIRKLRDNPDELEILGDGRQKKSYIYIEDCVDGMIHGLNAGGEVNVFNIGTRGQTEVSKIAEIVSGEMGLDPDFIYTGGERGWKGDVPVMLLSCEKLRKTGWKPKFESDKAVRKSTRDLLDEL